MPQRAAAEVEPEFRPSLINNTAAPATRLELVHNPELRSQFALCTAPVRNFSQLCAAFRLVYRQSERDGVCEPHQSGMLYSVYELLRNSMTFIALRDSEVSATVSAVLDSQCGLPCSQNFGAAVELLRAQGRILAEASKFATAVREMKTGDEAPLEVLKWLFGWCCVHGVDDLLITLPPAQLQFWMAELAFEPLSGRQRSKSAPYREEILMRLDVQAVLAGENPSRRKLREQLFSAEVDPVCFVEDYRMSEVEMSFLLFQRPEIADDLSMHQAVHFERFYPAVLERVEEERELVFCLV